MLFIRRYWTIVSLFFSFIAVFGYFDLHASPNDVSELKSWPTDGIIHIGDRSIGVPLYFPYRDKIFRSSSKIYARLKKERHPSGMTLLLSFDPGCDEQSICSIASISIYNLLDMRRMRDLGIIDRGAQSIQLDDGNKGYFTASTCGANCSPSSLIRVETKKIYKITVSFGGRASEDRRQLMESMRSFKSIGDASWTLPEN